MAAVLTTAIEKNRQKNELVHCGGENRVPANAQDERGVLLTRGLVDNVIKSAKERVIAKNAVKQRPEIHHDLPLPILAVPTSSAVAVEKLVDHAMKSAKNEIVAECAVIVREHIQHPNSSDELLLDEKETLRDDRHTSKHEILERNDNVGKQNELSSEAIRDVLDSFLCKMQEVATSTFAHDKRE